MKEIPLTHGKVAIVDDEDYEQLNRYKWHCTHGDGGRNSKKPAYAARRVFVGDGSRRSSIVLMHYYVLPRVPGLFVDHINRNGLDNRRENLRYCTATQNNHNQRARPGTSHYKGVCWSPAKRKWRANIHDGRQIHLGYFETEEQAARAYNVAARQRYGEFAWLNPV